jgi:type I restriction enzyme S subunit
MSEWPVDRLGNVATLQRGFDLPVQDRLPGTVQIFAANGAIGFHQTARVDGPGVVTGRSGSIGKVHYVEDGFWPLNTSLYVRDFHGNDPKYVYWLLREMKLEKYCTGTGVPTLNRNVVHEVPVPVPPLDEQRRIAAILDQADGVMRRRRLSLDHLESLKQAVFIEMFGEPELKNLRWPVKLLSEVAENQDSIRVPLKVADRSQRQGPYPYYGASGVIDSIDDFLYEGDRLLVSEDGANLLARSTPIAFVASGRFWVNNHAHVLASTGAVELKYLESVFARLDVKGYLTGSTQPKLTRSALDRIEVPVPPHELQREFVRRIQAVQELVAAAGRQMNSLSETLASLRDATFGGQL